MTANPPGAIHLIARVFEYVQIIEKFVGQRVELRLPIGERAVDVATRLAQRDPANEELARAVYTFMWPDTVMHPPAEFWATQLGQDIAWHIGYPHNRVPIAAAAAVLGINRVSVWRIQRQTGKTIDAKRLRELLRRRAVHQDF